MAAIAHRFHSLEGDGPWESPPFPAAEKRHIIQGVIGGYIMGRPRWATDLSGNFLYGLDAKGKEMTTPPAAPTKPRTRGKNIQREVAQLLVPHINKWSMTAGGTSAARDKHGYTFTVPEGAYHVSPVSSSHGRHIGYSLKFAAQFKQPKGGHGGLWHDLGMHRSPQAAGKAAQTHYASSY